MSETKFHNSEEIQDSIESLYRIHGDNRPIVYWLCIFVAAAAAICLPLIKVDMSVGAAGQVRPAIERLSVYPAVDGLIKELDVADNQTVHKGEVLLVFDSTSLNARQTQNQHQRDENTAAIVDLTLLLSRIGDFSTENGSRGESDSLSAFTHGEVALDLPGRLQTPQYVRQYAIFLSDLQRLQLQRSRAAEEMSRNKVLHDKRLISDFDFEQQLYAQRNSEKELDVSIQQTLGRWQADKIEHDLKKIDLDSEAKQLEKQCELYTVRAPVDGTALGFAGLHTGLYLPLGQRIGEISPGGGLQADVYVNPRDIGFVRAGQRASVQIDAFPYTEWGTIKGRVRDLSQDFVQLGQQVAFKAVIDLDATQLKSASGVTVELRRGMTVNARFVIKKRTLLNLLYGKLSDSLDPSARPMVE